MAGVQFTPFGLIPLGQSVPIGDSATVNAAGNAIVALARENIVLEDKAAREAREDRAERRPDSREADTGISKVTFAATKALDRKVLMAQVRDRVREIKAELKKVPALKDELAALERILSADRPNKRSVKPTKLHIAG